MERFNRFCQVIETGEPATFEEFYRYGGFPKWLLVRAAKRGDGVVITIADITERKVAEDKLRQSERLLQMAGHMSKVGGWTVEFPYRQLYWTDELYRIYEMDRAGPHDLLWRKGLQLLSAGMAGDRQSGL